MATALERGRQLVGPGRFHELRYEDLVRDPRAELRRLYEGLELGDFEPAAPAVDDYLGRRADFRPGGYAPAAPIWRAEVSRRWGPLVRRHGYEC
jgi:hypothetical protein